MARTLFISDLHLSPGRPDKLEVFRRFLRGPALDAAAVYILGDLFEEFWVGNDDRTPPNTEILDELRRCTSAGARIYFIRGNRELMLTPFFESLTGCRILQDQTVIELDGKRVLLMHGDRLCSRDRKYQIYRRIIENWPARTLFLSLPYRARTGIAHGLRPYMRRSAGKKPEAIIDADQATIERTMLAHDVDELIHGHTHRPGIHAFDLAGRPARRVVLGDWYERDSVLVCEGPRRELVPAADCLAAAERETPA